jgi:hypothetical protein
MRVASLLPTFPPSWNVTSGPTPHFMVLLHLAEHIKRCALSQENCLLQCGHFSQFSHSWVLATWCSKKISSLKVLMHFEQWNDLDISWAFVWRLFKSSDVEKISLQSVHFLDFSLWTFWIWYCKRKDSKLTLNEL